MTSKPAKHTCIYCGLSRSMSKEHIVANWVSKIVPTVVVQPIKSMVDIGRDHKGEDIITRFDYEFKQGHPGQAKLRRVCEFCNTRWMKDIQDSSIAILTPLIRGIWDDFNVEKSLQISIWTTMTVMNVDASFFGRGGIPRKERHFFYTNKCPPSNWYIWIGRVTGGNGMGYLSLPYAVYKRSDMARHHPDSGTDPYPRNAQVTTIELGQLLLHAISIPPGILDDFAAIDYGGEMGIIPIFPVWGGDILNWRFAPFLDRHHFHVLATEFVRLLKGGQ